MPLPKHNATDLCGVNCPLTSEGFTKNLIFLGVELCKFVKQKYKSKLPDLRSCSDSYDFNLPYCCAVRLFSPFLYEQGYHIALHAHRISGQQQTIVEELMKRLQPSLEQLPTDEFAPEHLVLAQLTLQCHNMPVLSDIFDRMPMPKCVLQALLIESVKNGNCCVLQFMLSHGALPLAELPVDGKTTLRPMDYAKGATTPYCRYFANTLSIFTIEEGMCVLNNVFEKALKEDPKAKFLLPRAHEKSDYDLVTSLASIAPQDPSLALKILKAFEPYVAKEFEDVDFSHSPVFSVFDFLSGMIDNRIGFIDQRPLTGKLIDHTVIVISDTFLFALLPLLRAGARMWSYFENFDFHFHWTFNPILSLIANSKYKHLTGTFTQIALEARSFNSEGILLAPLTNREERMLLSRQFPQTLKLLSRRAIVSQLPFGLKKRANAIEKLRSLPQHLKDFLHFMDFEKQLKAISLNPKNEHPRHADSGKLVNPHVEAALRKHLDHLAEHDTGSDNE